MRELARISLHPPPMQFAPSSLLPFLFRHGRYQQACLLVFPAPSLTPSLEETPTTPASPSLPASQPSSAASAASQPAPDLRVSCPSSVEDLCGLSVRYDAVGVLEQTVAEALREREREREGERQWGSREDASSSGSGSHGSSSSGGHGWLGGGGGAGVAGGGGGGGTSGGGGAVSAPLPASSSADHSKLLSCVARVCSYFETHRHFNFLWRFQVRSTSVHCSVGRRVTARHVGSDMVPRGRSHLHKPTRRICSLPFPA